MPNIIEYANQNDSGKLQVSDLGETSRARAAIRVSAVGDEAGNYIKQGVREVGQAAAEVYSGYEHKDYTQGLAAYTTALNTAHDEVLTAASAPGFADDPNAAANMDKMYTDRLQSVIGGVQTRFARENLTNHMSEMMARVHDQNKQDISSIAANQADSATNEFVDQSSQLATKNPGMMETLLGQLPGQIDNVIKSHPNIGPIDASKLRTKMLDAASGKIAMAGLEKIAMTNPGSIEGLLDSIAGNPLYKGVDGTRLIQISKQAIQQQKADALMARQNAELNRADAQRSATQSVFQDFAKANAEGKPPGPEVLTKILDLGAHGNLQLGAADALINMTKNQALNPENNVQSSATVLNQVQSRMLLPDSDPNHLTQEDLVKMNNDGQLSWHDTVMAHEKMNWMANNPETRAALGDFRRMMPAMTQLWNPKQENGMTDPGQGARVANYELQVQQRFELGLKRGLSSYQMLNTADPNFIMKDAPDQLNVTPEKIQHDMMELIGGGSGINATVPSLNNPGKLNTPAAPEEDDVAKSGLPPALQDIIKASRARQNGSAAVNPGGQ